MSNAMRLDDGGPAFPRPASEYTEHGTLHDGNSAIDQQDGMSLRDYFAAQAIAVWRCQLDKLSEAGAIAKDAYEIADAMLEARKGK